MTRRSSAAVRLAALSGVDAAVLWLARGEPAGVLRVAARPTASFAESGVDRVVATGAGAALWALALWIGIGLVVVIGTRLPGTSGRFCAAAARAVVPRCARRLVIGAVGVGLVVGPAALAASAGAAAAARPATSVTGSSGPAPVPAPSWPVTASPAAPARTTPARSTPARSTQPRTTPAPMTPAPMTPQRPIRPTTDEPTGSTVTVHAGDSLWLIAARRLDTDDPARITHYWPRVYAGNRGVIGGRPGLVRPGEVLRLPEP